MSVIENEHLALLRQWGRLQWRVDALQKEHAHQRTLWASEVIRLRAQLIIRETQVYWGMGATQLLPRLKVGPSAEPTTNVSEVICQAGCVSHAHAWLGSDDQCRLYGGYCEQTTPARSNN